MVTREGDVLGRSRGVWHGGEGSRGDGRSVVEIFSPGRGGQRKVLVVMRVFGSQLLIVGVVRVLGWFSGGFAGGIVFFGFTF